jgi:hypothetical protein
VNIAFRPRSSYVHTPGTILTATLLVGSGLGVGDGDAVSVEALPPVHAEAPIASSTMRVRVGIGAR